MQTKAKSVLGVDLGTSAVKCVVVTQGVVAATITAALTLSSPQPGWSEQDPDAWVTAAATAIRGAVAQSGVPSEQIGGIALSGQMHGAVTLDAAHRPLRPAILWNDNRATAECTALAKSLPQIGQIAGIGPLPGFTAPKLMWMRAHEPALFEAIRHILLPKDYLGLWLTGELATDTSDAAGTMWLDQARRVWSDAVIAASGIDAAWLPPLRNGFDRVGALGSRTAKDLGLPAGIPVFAGGGDAATGALSLGAASPGKCFMSLGTSGQFLVIDAAYSPAPERFIHAYCHTLPGTWYRMAAMLNGARPLAWFAQVLGRPVPEVLALAGAANPQRVPLFLPYLTGERSPHGDPDIRGGFYGLDDATGPGEMARAVIEAIAFSMGDAKDSFGPEFTRADPIPVIGGGSRSDLVLETLADTLGVPVARAEAGEGGAALGAALLAEVGLGLRSVDDLSGDPPLSAVWEPRARPDLTARHARYRALYQALKPLA